MRGVMKERTHAIENDDNEFAKELLTAGTECATMVIDRFGPEWFTQPEIEFLDHIFSEYNLSHERK
jgi:hypothetical protein